MPAGIAHNRGKHHPVVHFFFFFFFSGIICIWKWGDVVTSISYCGLKESVKLTHILTRLPSNQMTGDHTYSVLNKDTLFGMGCF